MGMGYVNEHEQLSLSEGAGLGKCPTAGVPQLVCICSKTDFCRIFKLTAKSM